MKFIFILSEIIISIFLAKLGFKFVNSGVWSKESGGSDEWRKRKNWTFSYLHFIELSIIYSLPTALHLTVYHILNPNEKETILLPTHFPHFPYFSINIGRPSLSRSPHSTARQSTSQMVFLFIVNQPVKSTNSIIGRHQTTDPMPCHDNLKPQLQSPHSPNKQASLICTYSQSVCLNYYSIFLLLSTFYTLNVCSESFT